MSDRPSSPPSGADPTSARPEAEDPPREPAESPGSFRPPAPVEEEGAPATASEPPAGRSSDEEIAAADEGVDSSPARARPAPFFISSSAPTWILRAVLASAGTYLAGWGLLHPAELEALAAAPDAARTVLVPALTKPMWIGLAVSVVLGVSLLALLLRSSRVLTSLRWLRRGWIAATLLPLLVPLRIPAIEWESPVFVGLSVLAWGFAVSPLVAPLLGAFAARIPDRERFADRGVQVLFAGFVLALGGLACWRHLTFRSQLYDLSWETNAVWGIVHTGLPVTTSGAAHYFPHTAWPAVYLGLHTPLVYYLYAPFFAIFSSSFTLLLLQAVHIGSGVFGVYWVTKSATRAPLVALVAATIYVANPAVQGYCLHDLHANVLAIPSALLAMGFFARRKYLACWLAVLLTAICREETGLIAATVGLAILLQARSKRDLQLGAAAIATGLAVFALCSYFIMPRYGGTPRWSYFSYHSARKVGTTAIVEAFALDPWGLVGLLRSPQWSEFLWLSLLPVAFLPLLAKRTWIFVLAPIFLLLPSSLWAFAVPGVNYSAPMSLAVFGMLPEAFASLRGFARTARGRRLLTTAPLVVALGTQSLFGSVFSKSYKLEYGQPSNRRGTRWTYRDLIGATEVLPSFGRTERAAWAVIRKLPSDAKVSTSWQLNAQVSNRPASYMYPFMGPDKDPRGQADWILLDKFIPLFLPTADWIATLRASPEWEITAESSGAVLFKRRGR